MIITFNGCSESIFIRDEDGIDLADLRVIDITILENIVVFFFDALQVLVLEQIGDEFMIMTDEVKFVLFLGVSL